jgi:hypothetical protein
MRLSRPARCLLAAACILAAGCLDRGAENILGATVVDPLGPQVWTVILTDSVGGVWVAQTDSAFEVHDADGSSQAAALWSVLDSAPTFRSLRLTARVHDRSMRWELSGPGVEASGDGGYFAYVGNSGLPRFTGFASLSLNGTGHRVRFDALGGLPMPAEPVAERPPGPRRVVHARGIVSLRVDDCGAADSISLRLLQRYHLVAEFAVPSRLVGRAGSCSPSLLDAIAAAGNAVEAHSRFHLAQPPTFADFYVETIGAQRDLRLMGFDPHVFVQPGSWRQGPTLFDSPAKLQTPYGALLRRAYEAVEAYQQPSFFVTIPANDHDWPGAPELPFYSVDQIESFVRQAAAQGQWVHFMWHSGRNIGPSLEARLSVIAALRDSGYVENLTFHDALHAVRSQ